MITRRTRRMASVAAIVAGTLVLGACGSSSGGSRSPGKAASQSAAASGPVTIKYLHRLPERFAVRCHICVRPGHH